MRLRDDAKEAMIRQKTVELIVNEGLEGFSMKDLARACDLSVSTIYVYFENKDDLLFKLTLELRIEHLSYSIRGLRPDMSFEEGLRLQWQNRFDYFMAHPQKVQAVERLKYTPQFRKTNPEVIRTFQPDLGRFVENAIKRGELAEMPFEVYWAIGYAPLYSLLEFHVAGESIANERFRFDKELIGEVVKRIAGSLKRK